MKAAIFQEPGKPMEIGDIPTPDPLPNELVLKVKACGICGSDLHCTEHGPFAMQPGTVLGHEFCGEVVAIGKNARERFREGERVTALPLILPDNPPVEFEDLDPFLRPDIQAIGLGPIPGGYAEYVRVGVRQTKRLPDEVTDEQGAMVEPLAVGLHGVNRAQIHSGDNVLIMGAGPIGLAATVFASRMGADQVIVSEMTQQRRELAESVGATGTVDAKANVLEQFMELTGGKMPDVVFEAVGVPGVLQSAIELVKPRGRVVIMGVCNQPDTIVPVMAIVKEISLQFVVGYEPRDWDTVISFLAQQRMKVDHLVTHKVGFEDFPAAFEALRNPTDQCKVMLKPL